MYYKNKNENKNEYIYVVKVVKCHKNVLTSEEMENIIRIVNIMKEGKYMQLPIMASPEDVLQVVKFLSTKVSGSTIDDAKAAIDKKLLDARKVNAYITWGFVQRDGDKLKQTELGKRLSKTDSSDEIESLYRAVIESVEPYAGAIEWFCYKKQVSITNVEIAEYWHDTKKYEMENENDNTLKDRAVCFFKVCEAAGFGKLIVGRRGQPTRLEINNSEITSFINGICEQNEDDGKKMIQQDEPLVSNFQEQHNHQSVILRGEQVSLPIPFVDGRMAVLEMPQNATKEDAKYVFDMMQLMLIRQYGLES